MQNIKNQVTKLSIEQQLNLIVDLIYQLFEMLVTEEQEPPEESMESKDDSE